MKNAPEKRAPAAVDYEDLLSKANGRELQIRDFDRFLREHTAWLKAPASTRFHLCKPGGLVEHSVNVARTLLQLRETLAPDLPAESCVIAALYHDIGKIGMPGKPYYIPWLNGKKGRFGALYRVNQDLVHLDIPSRSLFLVSSHIPLTEEESQAIRYHDGQYIDENRSVAHKECRLTRLLQFADNWAGCVLEAERTNEKSAT